MKLRYHRPTFDLLGEAPKSSKAAAAAVAARERELGISFPASVREWYSLQGVDDLMKKASGLGPFRPIAELGSPREVAHGMIGVQDECQGVAAWYICLDGSDDPPVEVQSEFIAARDESCTIPEEDEDDWPKFGWARAADRFSAFLLERFRAAAGDGSIRAIRKAIGWVGDSVTTDESGRIVFVSFTTGSLSNRQLGVFDGLGSLDYLRVSWARLTPEGWSSLAARLSVGHLDVSGDEFDDRCLARIVAFTGLSGLSLGARSVTDAGLADFLARKPLRKLHLSSEDLTDAGFASIGVQATLEELSLGVTRVSDAGLRTLAGMPALRRLVLSATASTDEGLEPVTRVPRLRSLNLQSTGIRGPGLRHLAGLPELQELNLRNTGIDDSAAPLLGALTELQDLDLGNTAVTDAVLDALATLPVLISLKVDGTGVTDAAVEQLRKGREGLRVIGKR
ncbi:Leucine Rich repeats (2 copies) [Aquisphaera giovannonii]|uniref:Leucine Rich repeats (2 copies) n=1 Tax=Aquisphaera giovannonii TaxID=406548 RepID=A0A5B9VWN7_9BACT|nr:hypothetical protein [Aquisphaera giovannonii]QEH32281.1 Leucine Rich repeats (2 copies) [Aquisphaera giovannonii]